MRTLTHRTGLSRGAAYAGDGSSITTFPEGAGNNMVGSWYLDYSSLFRTTQVPEVDEGFPIPIQGGYFLQFYDTEFSWVIADGRDLKGAQQGPDDDMYPDLDEDSKNEPAPHAVVQVGDRRKRIHRIEVDIWIVPPSYEDAHVYITDLSMSHPQEDTGLNTPGAPLDEWLDAMAGGIFGGEAIEDVQQNNVWADFWQYIRCPLHWALLRIPCYNNGNEGSAVADYENDPDSFILPGGMLPAYGPRGLIAAQDGFASVSTGEEAGTPVKDIRLWEPCDGLGFIRRGVTLLNFTNHAIDPDIAQAGDPDELVEEDGGGWNDPKSDPSVVGDTDIDLDEGGTDLDSFSITKPPGSNLYKLSKTFNLPINVGVNEMIVFMIQSGRARLSVAIEDNTPVASWVMASPAGFSPAGRHGPAFTIVHHTVTVHHT